MFFFIELSQVGKNPVVYVSKLVECILVDVLTVNVLSSKIVVNREGFINKSRVYKEHSMGLRPKEICGPVAQHGLSVRLIIERSPVQIWLGPPFIFTIRT